jgi:hypothetical protein|tara:strand:- start:21 stop:410 length:390 start_codon:yes stop_codon:yes gene_type:complete
MSEKNSKALVPIKKVLPPSIKGGKDGINPFELVNGNIQLQTREDVRSLLPDILGKVLARVWLDPSFHREFSQDPQKTLESNGVFLPENMSIEFQKQNTDRPRIVVFEQKPGSKFKLRVFYLQLVMMAGR